MIKLLRSRLLSTANCELAEGFAEFSRNIWFYREERKAIDMSLYSTKWNVVRRTKGVHGRATKMEVAT